MMNLKTGVPKFEGELSADGIFSRCRGCSLSRIVDFRTNGIFDLSFKVEIIMKGIYAVLYSILLWYAVFHVKRVFVPGVKQGGSTLALRRATANATIGAALSVAITATREAAEDLKGAFLILYPVYSFFNLFMEVSLYQALSNFIQFRLWVVRGKDHFIQEYVLRRHLVSILKAINYSIILIALARLAMEIKATVDLLDENYKTPGPLLLNILAIVATIARSIYIGLAILFIIFSIKLDYDQDRLGPRSLIPMRVGLASVFCFIWSLGSLGLFIGSVYTHEMDQRNMIHLYYTLYYDFPIFFTLSMLIAAAMQKDWYYDERNQPSHGVLEPFIGPGSPQSEIQKPVTTTSLLGIYTGEPQWSQNNTISRSFMDRLVILNPWAASNAQMQAQTWSPEIRL